MQYVFFSIGGDFLEQNNKRKNIILTVIIIFIIALISAVLILITLFSMYQKSEQQTNDSLSVKYITSSIIQTMGYKNLSEISQDNIYKYYEIPDGVVSESDMYISTRSDSLTEIACFKIADETRQDELMQSISEYLSSKSTSYTTANGKNHNIRTEIQYPYVFVIVSSDSDNAVLTFNSIIENQ